MSVEMRVKETPNTGLFDRDIDDENATFRSSACSSTGSSNDDDGDDNGSLSTDSSDDGEDTVRLSLTLNERQAKNIERNNRFLSSLQERYSNHLPPPSTNSPHPNGNQRGKRSIEGTSESTLNTETKRATGILMKDSYRVLSSTQSQTRRAKSFRERIEQLSEKYPHRETQIRQLSSLLDANVSSISTQSHHRLHVPVPIFCIGPASTGKTSVVCDVTEVVLERGLQSGTHPQLKISSTSNATSQMTCSGRSAYVDCSAIEPSSIERVVALVYRQLVPYSSRLKRRRKPTESKPMKKQTLSNQQAVITGSDSILQVEEEAKKNEVGILEMEKGNRTSADGPQVTRSDNNCRRRLPPRKARLTNDTVASKQIANSQPSNGNPNKQQSKKGEEKVENVETFNSAVVALGRSLQQYYSLSAEKVHSGILVLDNAEELLSLLTGDKKSGQRRKRKALNASSGNSSSTRATNFLSEVLLLPKIMNLNLTIVVVTKSASLYKTRLNNTIASSKSLATICSSIHPITVNFPAYNGNRMVCDVLSTAENCRIAMGNTLSSVVKEENRLRDPQICSRTTMSTSFQQKVVRAFWNAIIQFSPDAMCNVVEIIQLGRRFWPQFAAHLQPSQVCATFESFGRQHLSHHVLTLQPNNMSLGDIAKFEDNLLGRVGTRFYAQLASSTSCAPLNRTGEIAGIASTSHLFGYTRSCLLLSAFICQQNSATNDRKVFSSHGNGQRRKGNAIEDIYGKEGEEGASNSTTRYRPFVLERVFSIFVTLVHLNPTWEEKDMDVVMDSLGSTGLNEDLSYLVTTGLLHPVKHDGILNGDETNLASGRFTCSLDRNQALAIAEHHCIPLEQYLL